MAQLENIEAIEKRLWNAADTLRANSNYASNEYFMPVMGLIFLRHAYSRYLAVRDGIEANLPRRGGKARPLTKEDFSQKGAIFLRPDAQFDFLVSLPDSAKRDRAIQHAMDIIEEDYDGLNREKDRVTIENTFAALLKFVQALDDEESRAMREGLDEESLALFDLLLKPGLGKADIQRIKKVAAELLAALKAEKLRIDNWREKEATRDAVQVTIENFLWDDRTGLPTPAYSEEDVKTKSRDVYRHIHRVYPTIPSPFYAS